MEERLILKKGDILRNDELVGCRVVALIAVLGRRITNKYALKCSRIKLVFVVLRNMNKRHTAKNFGGKRGMKTDIQKM